MEVRRGGWGRRGRDGARRRKMFVCVHGGGRGGLEDEASHGARRRAWMVRVSVSSVWRAVGSNGLSLSLTIALATHCQRRTRPFHPRDRLRTASFLWLQE